jgi:hypothetical protein
MSMAISNLIHFMGFIGFAALIELPSAESTHPLTCRFFINPTKPGNTKNSMSPIILDLFDPFTLAVVHLY